MGVLKIIVVAISIGILLHSIWLSVKTYREVKRIKVQMDFWHNEFITCYTLACIVASIGDAESYLKYIRQAELAKRRYEIETEKLI